MLMVPLAEPLQADLSVSAALAYLEQNDFDLALLDGDDVRILYRATLATYGGPDTAVTSLASSPRVDRLIEHTLELGEIARRLRDNDLPLLVVGRQGPEYLITRSDFTRPAGQAAALAVLAALDSELDALIRPHEAEVWERLDPERQKVIDGRVADARRRNEDVGRLSFLTFGERLGAVRALDLSRELNLPLGSEDEHVRLTKVRNDIAHGRTPHGAAVIDALDIAERILDSLLVPPTPGGTAA
jgi:hypothetical protein